MLKRDLIIRSLRNWFHSRGFVEVQTPLLVTAPLPEASIQTFRIEGAARAPGRPGMPLDLYLAPSPELYMKRLLARGMEKIFQISPVFRREENGSHHLPEFTMLEWYRAGTDYTSLMEDCESMLRFIAKDSGITPPDMDGHYSDFSRPFMRLTVAQAFEIHAGWKPGPSPDPDRFNRDMVEKVEPGILSCNRPVFLTDYPASMASLARLKPSNPEVAERVELYAGGMELANGFSELNDPEEQAERFRLENARRRKIGLDPYPWPEEFLHDLKQMPEAAGMAMGVDRLVMLLTGARDIREVTAFQD